MKKIIIALVLGVIFGRYILPTEAVAFTDDWLLPASVNVLVLIVGIQLSYEGTALRRMAKRGLRVFLVPIGTVFGTLAGGAAAGIILSMPLNESVAAAAGMGWYTLSSVILGELSGPALGTLAFLANIFRELISITTTPFIAKKFGFLAATAPGGATSMDTSLPVIASSTDGETAVIAVMNGTICSIIVPFLVPLFYNLGF